MLRLLRVDYDTTLFSGFYLTNKRVVPCRCSLRRRARNELAVAKDVIEAARRSGETDIGGLATVNPPGNWRAAKATDIDG